MRKLALIFLAATIPLFFTACFDANEIGDFAYVSLLGIEQGVEDTFRFT
ncbi:MAG TPA: Ger(x)C family spore germination protein, partial [Ruminiclostridium sp.]|nr:Ger(x)C family spore germination protein [Ruminiclostridium sp.]